MLGRAVLCGTAGVMIVSALVADPPVAVDGERSTGLFTIRPTLAQGRSEMSTTSFAVPVGPAPADAVVRDCFVVPPASERDGGVVTLTTRIPVAGASGLAVTVEREVGAEARCNHVASPEVLYGGPMDGLVADEAGRSGIVLADVDDERLVVRVRIDRTDGRTPPRDVDATAWLDVRHRTAADR